MLACHATCHDVLKSFFFVPPTWALSWRGLYANSDTLRLYLTLQRCKAAFNRQEIEEQKRLQEEQLDKTNRISLYHAIHAMDICGIRLNWLNKATVFVLLNLFLHLLLCSPATPLLVISSCGKAYFQDLPGNTASSGTTNSPSFCRSPLGDTSNTSTFTQIYYVNLQYLYNIYQFDSI